MVEVDYDCDVMEGNCSDWQKFVHLKERRKVTGGGLVKGEGSQNFVLGVFTVRGSTVVLGVE